MWVEDGKGVCPAIYRPVSVDEALRGKQGGAEETAHRPPQQTAYVVFGQVKG